MSLKRHKVLDIHGPLEDKQLGKIFQRNSPRASNRNVAARYRDEFSHSEIHVRSSFNEVGSAVYRAKYNPSQVDPKLLSDILTFETGYTAETLAATEEYVDSTNMLNISGYDPLDLYYWELRMGSWLGNISQESDIAFDTHILINSREIVRTLLSAPLSDRVLMNTYHELISQILARFILNPSQRKAAIVSRPSVPLARPVGGEFLIFRILANRVCFNGGFSYECSLQLIRNLASGSEMAEAPIYD